MSEVMFVFYVALGVLGAVVYPTLYGAIRKQFPAEAAPGLPSWMRSALKKYGLLFLFCVVTAVIVVAVFRQTSQADVSVFKALLLGFGFEAIIEKLFFPHTASKRTAASSNPKTPRPEQPS